MEGGGKEGRAEMGRRQRGQENEVEDIKVE